MSRTRRVRALLVTARRRAATRVRHGGRLPPVCRSVRDRAIEEGWPVVDLAERHEVVRTPPRSVEPQVGDDAAPELRYTLPERSLVTIPGARMLGPEGLVVLADGAYLRESGAQRAEVRFLENYLGPPRRPLRRVAGEYFSLLGFWSHNHYHWVHDILTRLYGLDGRLPPEVRFLVPADATEAQFQSLAAVGVAPEQTVAFSGDEVWEVERLHFVRPPGRYSTWHEPDAERWLAERLRRAVGAEAAPRRRLLVNRADAPDRRLVNHDAVAAALAPLGFETVTPGALDLTEQIRTFSAADIVVGVHGAGLLNVMFAAPGAALVEILNPTRPVQCRPGLYWSLASACGLDYWHLAGEVVPLPRRRAGRNDLTVDPSRVVATVEAVLAERGR